MMAYISKTKKGRRAGSRKMLKLLFAGRRMRKCAYCSKRLNITTATFDHVRALSQGGYNKSRNGAIACGPCNFAKGSMSKGEFIASRAALDGK